MAVHHLSQLVVLVIWIAHLPYAIGASCVADNVLRAFRAEAEVGVLDCQYILGIPQPTAVITSTIYVTLTFTSKTKTIKSSGTTTVFSNDPTTTRTGYTTTYVPYLPTYVSQYPEARVSSACSCVSQPVITVGDFPLVYVSTTVPGTTTITRYQTTETTSTTETKFPHVTTTFPAICYSSFLTLNFATANPQRPVTTIAPSPGISTTTDEDCCMSCFHAKNCLYWRNEPSAGCKIILGTTKVGDLVLNVCPLGIQNNGGLSKPGATTAAYNPGPCFKQDATYLFAAPFN